MKAWGRIAVGACAVALTLATAPTALAKPGYTVVDPSFSLEAQLPKSNGYRVSIASSGHRRIELVASKGTQAARYVVEGRANRNRLDADFGRFGAVSLRFRGKPAPPHEGILEEILGPCHGPDTRRLIGTLRGNLRFHGENGFVDIATHRAQAEVTRTFRRTCGQPQDEPGDSDGNEVAITPTHPHPHGDRLARGWRLASHPAAWLANGQFRLAQLLVQSRSEGHLVSLLAFDSEPELLSIVIAGEAERVGRVAVKRAALLFPEHNPLSLSEPGAETLTGVLRVPRPFSGSAEYAKAPGARPRWTGSLRVSLPGEKPLALTGPDFSADLCISENPKQLHHCDKLFDPS
jgi:hypothetical protein